MGISSQMMLFNKSIAIFYKIVYPVKRVIRLILGHNKLGKTQKKCSFLLPAMYHLLQFLHGF